MRNPPHGAAPAPGAQRLAAACAGLVALCFGLIVLGALVRANEAGLACPDWPRCFGRWIPEMDLRVAFEYTHRAVAGSVFLLFAALFVGVLRRPQTRHAAAFFALASALLCAQVLLGALTVWKLLAPWTVTLHLLTGNAFAATLLLGALALRDGPLPARAPVPAAARGLVAAAALLLLVQLALGGLVASRYAGLACPEWPTCRDGLWVPTWQGPVGLQLLHRTNGYALALCLAAAAFAARRAPALRGPTRLALLLVLAQLAVGVANVLLALRVEVTGLHSALAAALVLALAWAAREAWLGRPRAVGARRAA